MSKIIYANKEHQIVIEQYIGMLKEFSRDVANDIRWKNYKEIFEIVIEYHNNYGKSYKVLLNEMLQDVVDKLEKIEPVND